MDSICKIVKYWCKFIPKLALLPLFWKRDLENEFGLGTDGIIKRARVAHTFFPQPLPEPFPSPHKRCFRRLM